MALAAMVAIVAAVIFFVRPRGPELNVSAAVSLTEALLEAGRAFEQEAGIPVRFNFAGSSTLVRQIEAGAPADLFVSADEAKMDSLEEGGLLVPGTRRDLLSNTLVVITRPDLPATVSRPDDLLDPAIRRIAVAEPSSVPAGIYARSWLTSAHLWDRLSGRVVPTEDVRAALAAVESGNADVGIVYRTDAARGRRLRVAFEVPRQAAPPIVYPGAVLRESRSPGAARAFLEFLASPRGLAILAHHGFGPP